MRSVDISMLIIIQLYSKWECVHTTNYVFLILTFSALRVCLRFLKKKLFGVYSMTKCGKSRNKAVYNYENDNFVIKRGRQNVTSESTPSGLLTS